MLTIVPQPYSRKTNRPLCLLAIVSKNFRKAKVTILYVEHNIKKKPFPVKQKCPIVCWPQYLDIFFFRKQKWLCPMLTTILKEKNFFPEKQKCPLRMLTSQRREEVLLGRDVAERMNRVRSKQWITWSEWWGWWGWWWGWWGWWGWYKDENYEDYED